MHKIALCPNCGKPYQWINTNDIGTGADNVSFANVKPENIIEVSDVEWQTLILDDCKGNC